MVASIKVKLSIVWILLTAISYYDVESYIHLMKFEKPTLSNVAPFIVVSQDSPIWKIDKTSGYVET